jgi:hypothetical protein
MAFGLGGLRYARNVSVVRHLIGLVVAPFLMIVAWLPIPALVIAWQIVLNMVLDIALTIFSRAAGSSPGLAGAAAKDFGSNVLYQYEMFLPMLGEVWLSFPIIMLLLPLPLMRDLATRVWVRTHSRQGDFEAP